MINRLKITFLLFLLAILMVTMGSAIGGKSGMIFAFIMALGMNFFSYWFSGKIVLMNAAGAHLMHSQIRIVMPECLYRASMISMS